MSKQIRNGLVLVAAASLAAALGGCGGGRSTGEETGRAQVNISFAVLPTDVSSLRLTISGGSPALSAPIVQTLGGTNGLYTGTIANIPAGTGRLFKAEALNAASAVIYSGQATVDILANQTAQVYILAQEVGGGGTSEAWPPVIDSLTASLTSVAPGGTVNLGVTAHSATVPAGTLAYAWSATCYPAQTPAQNGTFAGGTTTSATWTAPSIVPASCVLRVDVKQGDLWSIGYLIVAVQSADAGNAGVTVYANTWPVVRPENIRSRVHFDQPVVTGYPPVLGTNTVVHMRLANFAANPITDLVDPDGDALAYAWSTDCPGTLAPMIMGGADMGPAARILTIPDTAPACTVTVVVSDLCTAGNCAGLGLADGAPRGGSTSVRYNIPAKWSGTQLTPPGAPTAVSASLDAASTSVVVSFTAPADTGGGAITNYAVASSPAGLAGTGASSPITVPCNGSCAGRSFTVTAFNVGGAGVASAAANVITSFGVVETFLEPMTQPNNSIFTGTFTLDSTTRTVTGLAGSLTESMTKNGGVYAPPMTTVTLGNQLSAVPDGLGGNGLLVTSFLLGTVDTFYVAPSASYPLGTFDPTNPGGVYFGFPAPWSAATANAYAMILVDTDNPTAALTQAQIDRLSYADCTAGGMMSAVCMAGTTVAGYGHVGSMMGHPVSQVIAKLP